MSELRLIHVTPSISEEASGPSYSVPRLCEALQASGNAVTLAALNFGRPTPPNPLLQVFPLGLGPRRIGHSPALRRWLDERAAAGQVDILHNHSMWQMCAVYPASTARAHRVPYLASPRGTLSAYAFASGSMLKPAFWRLWQRAALDAVDCFHATAEAEYRDIRRHGFRQPVAVIPNGVDIPPPVGKVVRPVRTLLYLGRLHPEKGLEQLLAAWEALESRFADWRLRIVGGDGGVHGSSGYLERLRGVAGLLGLQRVDFDGPLFGKDKWSAYVDAELFVLPSPSENFGMSVAESLAAGTPAVATYGAPWAGLEKHGAGRWVELGVDPLVGTLEELLSADSAALAAMGSRGRDWMCREYSWAGIAGQMESVYQWLLGRVTPVPAALRLE